MSNGPNYLRTGRIYVDLEQDGKYILFSATYECELHLVLLTHENRKKFIIKSMATSRVLESMLISSS